MFKFLFIAALLALLAFFIVRRLGFFGNSVPVAYLPTSDWLEIGMDSQSLRCTVKQTLLSVLIGFVLFIIVLVIAAKFRIALIMLPISFYLIGQYFVWMNQVKALRKQQMFYNHRTHEVKVRAADSEDISFYLEPGAIQLKEVRAVQKNNGILLGYYRVLTPQYKFVIPFLLRGNFENKPFFDRLDIFPREIESKLFPII